MRIQHNIPAMNAYRNYNTNVKSLQGNLQKLSSGYKINKAGDDAAGLAISEKMRAQITGLEVAQKNAKDGISLVQTAEGAMTEIHTMLNRMFSLAEQSANGTYDDDVDREQLNNEFDKLKQEIDRIADATNFNGKKLLNGNLDGEIPSGDEAVAEVKTPKTSVDTTNDAKLDTAATKFAFASGAGDDDKKALNEILDNTSQKVTYTSNSGTGTGNSDTYALDFSAGSTFKALTDAGYTIEAMDADTTPSPISVTSGNATLSVGAGSAKIANANIALTIKKGTTTVGTVTIGKPTTVADTSAHDSTISFTVPGDSISGAELESAAAEKTALTAAGIESIDFSGVKVEEGAAVKAEYDGTNKKLIVSIGDDKYEYTAAQAADKTQGDIKLKKAGGTDEITVTLAKDQTVIGSDKTANVAEATVGKTKAGVASSGPLRLRVGDSTQKYDNIYVAIKSMKAKDLADLTEGTGKMLNDLGIGYATKEEAKAAGKEGQDADTAMQALKGMINYVSNERGKLGATQNRLDHTINNLSTMQENIQDAESTIRDVDVAEEMMKYTKNNILVQSAQAMLAQANQLPQGVLQLLG